MDTRRRPCLILIFLFAALTGYSQNMRTRSSTTTFATTNYGHATHSNLTASTAVTAPAAGLVVLLASNNTFFSLSSAGVLTDLGAAGAGVATIDTGRLLWVLTNGNDGTALRGRLDKPFLTLTAAKAASISGDEVVVGPGVYAENDLWKGGVTWNFHSSASLQFTDPGTGAGRGLFDDQSDPGTTCIVNAPGSYFKHLQANGFTLGAFVLTHASSRLHLNARRIEVGEATQDDVSAIYVNNGNCFAKVTEIVEISADPTAGGARSGCLFFAQGYADFDVDYLEAAAYGLWCRSPDGSPIGKCFYRGDNWVHRSDGSTIESLIAVKPATVGTPNTNYLTVGHVNRIATFTGGTVAYVGTFHLTCDETTTKDNAAHEFNYACNYHLTVNKVLAEASAGAISGIWQMVDHTAEATIKIGTFSHQHATQPAVRFQGTGTVMIEGQQIKCANGKGIDCIAAGNYRVKGFQIDTRATDNSANNPITLGNSTTGLVLSDVSLLAPPLANSISAAVARTVAVEGTLQMNLAHSANVTFPSGIVNIGSNSYIPGTLTLRTAGNIPAPVSGDVTFVYSNNTVHALKSSGALVDLEAVSGAGVSDGDKGDVVVSSSGTTWLLDLTGPLIRPPAKTVNASIAVTGTNFWTIAANTNFTLTLTGAPTNGQLITLVVSNFNTVADIIMTNLAGIYDFSVGSNRTLITIASNSHSLFGLRYLTNFVAAGKWYFEQDMGLELGLEAGLNNTLGTNGATRSVRVDVGPALTATTVTLTNNMTFVTTNMIPTGNATNFAGTYNNGWTTYLMTNAFRLTGMVDVAAANLGKAWIAKLRNLSGGALRVSVDATFRRSGTNDVSVGNNQNADVLVTPDGTGGVNPTNHTVQIILYDSP